MEDSEDSGQFDVNLMPRALQSQPVPHRNENDNLYGSRSSVIENTLTSSEGDRIDRRNERRKTLILEAYNEQRSYIPEDIYDDEESYENVNSDTNSLPPTYEMYALVSVFFCLPLGLYAIHHARKGKRAFQMLDAKTIRSQSIKVHQYATLAICYGVIFWSAFMLVFALSPEIPDMIRELTGR